MKKLLVIALIALAACATAPRETAMEVRVYSLKYANSQGVVNLVSADEKQRAGLNELAADARTNSVVAKGSREGLDRLDARIRELDVP